MLNSKFNAMSEADQRLITANLLSIGLMCVTAHISDDQDSVRPLCAGCHYIMEDLKSRLGVDHGTLKLTGLSLALCFSVGSKLAGPDRAFEALLHLLRKEGFAEDDDDEEHNFATLDDLPDAFRDFFTDAES